MDSKTIAELLGIEENKATKYLASCGSYVQYSLINDSVYHSEELCEATKKGDVDYCVKYSAGSIWDNKSWNTYHEDEKKRKEVKINRVANTSITCKKCKAQNVQCTPVQKRSADEGMTQCFECFNCGNKWNKN